jgi:hypothetical protein
METPQIDTSTQTEIIQNLLEKLKTCYVFPDVGLKICENIQKHLENGEYAEITEGEFFAYALTTHLQETNYDQHLWVRWHSQPLPDEEEALHLNQTRVEEQKEAARLDNYGFYKVERLPGNVGYLDLRYFYRPAWGGEIASAALNLLANTHALIIDLRHCEGGYPGMVVLVSSYLFGTEPVHLNSIYWHDDGITQQYWTQPFVPGQRFADKPVYVLVGKGTFSAGEGFASSLHFHKRATIIGEKTEGGAHPGASYRLHPHFEAFIPIGYAINPVMNETGEGSGIIPDVSTPPEQALNTAYKLALNTIIGSLGEPTSGPTSRLLKEAQSALKKLT